MIRMTMIVEGEHAGGFAVLITGAESGMLGTLAHEQGIAPEVLLERLITDAIVRTAPAGTKLGRPQLVVKDPLHR